MGKFYITTPIYYVNDEPHLGHAYSTVLADVLSRYHRLFGDEVFFSTGTDEHGLKVQEAARKRGVKARRHCDEMVVKFVELWGKLKIKYTRFIRTTESRHKFVVQNLLTYLYERGDIYFDTYVGKYCIPEERFWTEKDLVEGKCPSCGREVITIEEKNYFFKLSKYRDWLIEYIENNPQFIKPESRKNEVLGFLKNHLSDLCISRPKSRLDWGIEIPFDKKFVTYVWFDALINYISNIGVYRDNVSFQKWWPCDIHLVGKDIITTHAVYWPIMLKSAGFDLPGTVFAHGWWMVQNEKMSKSVGNIVRPIHLIDKYGPECFRYVLIKNMVLGSDANFSEELLVNTINYDLANDYGNLLNRLVKMVQKYFNGTLPDAEGMEERDRELMEKGNGLSARVKENIENMELNQAVNTIFEYVKMINKYIDDTAPWSLYKQGRMEQLKTVLYTGCEAFRLASVFLAPIIVDKAEQALRCFGESARGVIDETNTHPEVLEWGRLQDGVEITPFGSLFPRIELDLNDQQDTENTGEETVSENISQVDMAQFRNMDIRVAEVVQAEHIEGSKKLLRMDVDIGKETTQIVAGIAHQYKPEDLVGKRIVVLVNLKPTTLMGYQSNGMLLAASRGEKLSLLGLDREIEPGSRVM